MGWSSGVEIMKKTKHKPYYVMGRGPFKCMDEVDALYRSMGHGRYEDYQICGDRDYTRWEKVGRWCRRVWWLICDLWLDMRGLKWR